MSFVHDSKFLPLLPNLVDNTTRIGRTYRLDDGTEYPSITTVLKDTGDKTALINWKKRVGDAEAAKVSAKATSHGTLVHSTIEKILDNVEPTEVLPVETQKPIDNITPVLHKHMSIIYAQEVPLCSHLLKCAGRVDCVGTWDGEPAIIDFKTSRKDKKKEWIEDYFIQTTAYSLMWEEWTKQRINKIVILIALSEPYIYHDPYQLFVAEPKHYMRPLKDRLNEYYR